MSPRRRRPTIPERDAFILKLIAFGGELAPAEQRLLDAMAIAAFCEQPPDPDHGYAHVRSGTIRPTAEGTPWMAAYDRIRL